MSFDWNFYLNLICSIGGIIFFVYSLTIIKKIKKLFPGANIIKKWIIIQVLIVLFLVGYIINIISLALELIYLLTIMTAIVYIFGGLFVLITINLAYKTYKLILLESSKK
ncbi:MAG: hypothetical protein ACTSRI_10350 [Promethearchaeota archaeon]